MDQTTEQPKSIARLIKHELIELVDSSSFHGFPRISTTKNILSKIFWLVASLASYAYCAYLVIGVILDYKKYEVVTRYESVNENRPPFPYVIFCDHDKNKTECIFNGEKCPDTDKTTSKKCEVFNENASIPILKSKEYGSGSGLRVRLYTNESTWIRVYSANHSTQLVTDPRYISPGLKTTFVIRRVFESRLPAPYSNCRMNETGTKKMDELNRVYYQSVCFYYCQYYLIAENCNMLDKFLEFSYLYYTNHTSDFYNSFYSTIRKVCNRTLYNEAIRDYWNKGANEVCKKLCPIQCNTFSLSISAFYEKMPDSFPTNYAEFYMFYETFDFTIISQTPKITSDVILGTIGGLIGLFLGASLLSFGEFFEILLRVATVFITSKKIIINNYNFNQTDIIQMNYMNVNDKKLKKRNLFKIKTAQFTNSQHS